MSEPINSVPLYSGERIDDLERNGLFIIQHEKRFRFGIDAVCLTDFATIKKGERVLDLCTGTGVIPILLYAKTECRSFTGLELQPESADMARRSVEMNNLGEYIKIDEGDLKQAAELYGSAVFDVITVNPPYITHGGGIINGNAAKALARHEIACTLNDVVTVSARLLKPGGRFYMVYRPQRLTDAMCALRGVKLEPKTIQFIQPRADTPPVLVMIEAVDHGRPMNTVLPVRIL